MLFRHYLKLPVYEVRRFDDEKFRHNRMKPADSCVLDHRDLHPKLMNGVNITSHNCSIGNVTRYALVNQSKISTTANKVKSKNMLNMHRGFMLCRDHVITDMLPKFQSIISFKLTLNF